MSHRSEPRLLVLHALRLKGFAQPEPVALCSRLDETEVEAELHGLAEAGLALHREGRVSGWSLTPAGREEHARRLAVELEAAGAREAVAAGYRRFLEVNTDMLSVCTAWQLRDVNGTQSVNDHTDAAYDAGVAGRLRSIHERVQPVTTDLAGSLERYAGYGERLTSALERVQAGEPDWFTKPVIDSYHTVWFEMHEDLLSTLGIERASEGQG